MTWLFWAVPAVCLAGFGVWLYRMIMSPELQYHSFWYKVKAKLVFWVGDIRRLEAFPWVTWAPKKHHKVTYREMRRGADACMPGDIGLHKDEGYASNLAIPGGFKHAWVCVKDGDIVEAISDGVIKRGALAPLVTDYAIILRPMGVSRYEIDEAVRKANSIVGSDYDANFNFNFEETKENLKREERKFVRNLGTGKFHPAFSCTEAVGYSWYHCRKRLRIFRSKHAGRDAIIGDDYLRMSLRIVWMSDSVTAEWAKESGMPEEAVQKILEFRTTNST